MSETTETTLNIVQIISKISDEAGVLGLTNSAGVPFAFRGINATVDHLSAHLDKYGVVIVPEIISHKVEMHPVGNRFLTDAEVVARYTFYAPDGTSISATTLGYAQDYADRAAAQAQSVAFRVALLQTFHLPTSDPEPEVIGEENAKITASEKQNEAKVTKTEQSIADVRTEISALINDPNNTFDGEKVNALGDKLTGSTPAERKWTAANYRTILKEMKSLIEAEQKTGEVAEV